jgi:hypothetical protein
MQIGKEDRGIRKNDIPQQENAVFSFLLPINTDPCSSKACQKSSFRRNDFIKITVGIF